MTKESQPDNKQLVALVAAALLPVMVTGRLFSIWLAKPLALALSAFVWYFGVYWIPPKPKVKPWAWLMIVALFSVAIYFLVRFDLSPF